MDIKRLIYLIERDWIISMRSKERIFEAIYMPIIGIFIWGFFALYSKTWALEAGIMVLAINIFWNFAYSAQTETNIMMLFDVWGGSLRTLLTTPIKISEYITAKVLLSIIKSVIVFLVVIGISYFMFSFKVIETYFTPIMLFAAITLISSTALAIIVAGLLMLLGREWSSLSWVLISVFVFLSAPFFPLELFPSWIQMISRIMPYTDVFQGIRTIIVSNFVPAQNIIQGFIISFLYLVISINFFFLAFNRAKKNGNLARMF